MTKFLFICFVTTIILSILTKKLLDSLDLVITDKIKVLKTVFVYLFMYVISGILLDMECPNSAKCTILLSTIILFFGYIYMLFVIFALHKLYKEREDE